MRLVFLACAFALTALGVMLAATDPPTVARQWSALLLLALFVGVFLGACRPDSA